jgi:hypothetical protein
MASKELKFQNEARESLKTGLDTLADAVKVTLGPQVEMFYFKRVEVHLILLKMVYQ